MKESKDEYAEAMFWLSLLAETEDELGDEFVDSTLSILAQNKALDENTKKTILNAAAKKLNNGGSIETNLGNVNLDDIGKLK